MNEQFSGGVQVYTSTSLVIISQRLHLTSTFNNSSLTFPNVFQQPSFSNVLNNNQPPFFQQSAASDLNVSFLGFIPAMPMHHLSCAMTHGDPPPPGIGMP